MSTSIKLQEIADRLALLGLTQDEAMAYVQLHRTGSCKASDFAAVMRINRTDAYRRLQNLCEKGFAQAEMTKPTTYRAVPINVARDKFVSTMSARMQGVEQIVRDVEPFLLNARLADGDDVPPTARIVMGRRAVAQLIMDLLRNTTKEVCILSTRSEGMNILRVLGVLDTALELIKTGVRFRVLVCQGHKLLQWPEVRSYDNVEVRILGLTEAAVCYISDGTEILVGLHLDSSPRLDSDEESFLQTDSPHFVKMQQALFNALWADSVAPSADEGTLSLSPRLRPQHSTETPSNP